MYVVSEALSDPAPVTVPEGLRYGVPCSFKGCAAFFHPAAGSVGVVLCPPWGFEDLVMRKSWRLLAEAIAVAGYPCLRFDYPGTGDSLGHATSVTRVSTWVESIHDAAELLRLNTGVRRYVFIGQSLGATLALEAARARTDVVALQLVAPIAKGRAYVRELAATAAMVAGRLGIPLALEPDEGLSVVGFGLSKPLVEDLKRIDATRIPELRVADVTIFDSADRKAGAEVAEHLRRLGATVTSEAVTPYQLMVSDATEIQPLPVTPESVVAALRRAAPPRTQGTVGASRYSAALVAERFREEPIRFGAERALFGVLARPLAERPGATAVILLNRGLNPHIGWRRVSVDQARDLALAGITSLRIDVAGLGESRDEPGRTTRDVYSESLLPDIRAAVDELSARGYARIALSGVCSGAYISLCAAHADPRVTDVVAFNPQRFVWNPAESVEDVLRYGLRSVDDYVGDLKRGGILRKLVKSRRRIVPALAFLARKRLQRAASRLPLTLRSLVSRSSMSARVAALFTGFAERGMRLTLVYSEGDPSLDELDAYFGRNRRIGIGTVSVSVLEGVDHNFTSGAACEAMLGHLVAALGDRRQREERRSAARAWASRAAAAASAPRDGTAPRGAPGSRAEA